MSPSSAANWRSGRGQATWLLELRKVSSVEGGSWTQSQRLSSLPVPCIREKPGVWDWQWGLMRLLKRGRHQARGAAARGRTEGAPRCLCGGECRGEAHLCPRGDAALELEPHGSGVLSTSPRSLDWPGRLLHRPALSAQSPRTRPSGVASWDGPAAVPDGYV